MVTINAGILSIVPPVISIIFSLLTKEVITSLIIGILSGITIYAIHMNEGILYILKTLFAIMSEAIAKNTTIIIFICILGAIVHIITTSGSMTSYIKWASKRIKSKKISQLVTIILGILLSIDDYFNCLTVGTIMQPIVEKHKVSKAKFAFIIDSIAAPICVISPISSWSASIVSCINNTGVNGMTTFITSIQYNFYAIFTIFFVIFISLTDKDFGPMAKFEYIAKTEPIEPTTADEYKQKNTKSGSMWDLIMPVLVLIAVSILTMLETGGFFSKNISLAEAFGNTNSNLSITIGAFSALIVCFVIFLSKKILKLNEFISNCTEGIKDMISPLLILVLAWTLSDVCRNLLNTGDYISTLLSKIEYVSNFIPAIVFIASGVLSLAIGTSWGTFSILIPVIATSCSSISPNLTVIAISAVLAGSILGDHCSPISDTMILSSTSAKCKHMDHVVTQIPYSMTIAFCSIMSYIILGLTYNLVISLLLGLLILIILTLLANKFFGHNKEIL